MSAACGIVFQLADRATIAACDPAAAAILGYSTEQLAGKALWDLPWQAIVQTDAYLESEHPALVALRTGQSVLDAVMGFDRPDGAFVRLKLDARPLFAADATAPYGVVTAICDVTDQKRYLTASPAPEAPITQQTANNFSSPVYQIELETLYTTAPIGLCFIDTDLRFVRINQQLADINGFAIGDHIGRTLREMLPEQADDLEPIYRQVIASGEPLLDLEFRGVNIAEPGIERDWLLNLSPLLQDDGAVFGVNVMVQEITERKRISQALRDSENRVTTILDSISDAFVALDFQWRITYANQRGVETIRSLTNLEPDGFFGKSHWEIFPPTAGQIVEREYRRAVAEQVAVHFEFEYAPTGDWFEVHAYPSAIGLGIYFRNISDRKQTEAALGESEHRYRRLFEAMDQGFCVCEIVLDENGEPIDYRFLEVNPMFEKMTELQDAAGKTARELVPNLEAFWIEAYGRVVRTGEAVRFENGSEAMNKWFEVSAFRLDGPSSLKFAVLFTNITDRKLAEIAREKSEERLSLAIESAGMATWDMDMQTGRCVCSRSHFPLLGYDEPVASGEMTFEMWQSRLHPDDAAGVMQALEDAQNTRSAYSPEYRIIRADTGEIRWLKTFGRFLYGETGAALRFIGVVFDASDRKQAEIEREQLLARERLAREESESANRIKDEFLAVLSHELRSPLNPILGWVKLLQTRKFDETRTKTALATIERNAQLQAQLIEDLLDISRVMGGKLSLSATPVSLTFVISSAIETVRLAASAKNIQLTEVLEAEVDRVFGDRGDCNK